MSGWLWVLGAWAATTVATMAIAGAVIVTAPADYLRADNRTRPRHWTFRLVRSTVGAVLVLVGLALSLPGIPGQGVLTILAGLMLIEFPGRRRLLRSAGKKIPDPELLAELMERAKQKAAQPTRAFMNMRGPKGWEGRVENCETAPPIPLRPGRGRLPECW